MIGCARGTVTRRHRWEAPTRDAAVTRLCFDAAVCCRGCVLAGGAHTAKGTVLHLVAPVRDRCDHEAAGRVPIDVRAPAEGRCGGAV